MAIGLIPVKFEVRWQPTAEGVKPFQRGLQPRLLADREEERTVNDDLDLIAFPQFQCLDQASRQAYGQAVIPLCDSHSESAPYLYMDVYSAAYPCRCNQIFSFGKRARALTCQLVSGSSAVNNRSSRLLTPGSTMAGRPSGHAASVANSHVDINRHQAGHPFQADRLISVDQALVHTACPNLSRKALKNIIYRFFGILSAIERVQNKRLTLCGAVEWRHVVKIDR